MSISSSGSSERDIEIKKCALKLRSRHASYHRHIVVRAWTVIAQHIVYRLLIKLEHSTNDHIQVYYTQMCLNTRYGIDYGKINNNNKPSSSATNGPLNHYHQISNSAITTHEKNNIHEYFFHFYHAALSCELSEWNWMNEAVVEGTR